MEKVRVQLGDDGLADKIFRTEKEAFKEIALGVLSIVVMGKATAVEQIRMKVFVRDEFTCVKCGQPLSWDSAQMDEREARGKCTKQDDGDYKSGEVSVTNCQTLCQPCHTGPNGKHQRQPQWDKGPGL